MPHRPQKITAVDLAKRESIDPKLHRAELRAAKLAWHQLPKLRATVKDTEIWRLSKSHEILCRPVRLAYAHRTTTAA
jgi:hypothetical protein